MTSPLVPYPSPTDDTWHQENQRFLAAGLTWLRLLLTRAAERGRATIVTPAVPLPEPAPRGFRWLMLRQPAGPPVVTPVLAPPTAAVTDADVLNARAEWAARDQSMASPPALTTLATRLGLDAFERDVLFLCVAMELDTRIAGLCAAAQDDPTRTYPTFALAMALLDGKHWDAVAPDGRLRALQLVAVAQSDTVALMASPLRAEERVVAFVTGLSRLDEKLLPLLQPLDIVADTDLPPSQQTSVSLIERRAPRWMAGAAPDVAQGHAHIVQLVGADAAGKQLVAQHAARVLGLRLYRLPAALLPTGPAELDALARLWQRESRLLPVGLYLDAGDIANTGSPERVLPPISQFVARTSGTIFLDVRDIWPGLSRSSVIVDVQNPTPAEQRAAWEAELGVLAGDAPDVLTGQFNVSLPTIRELARTVKAEAQHDPTTLREALWDACSEVTRPRLEQLAQRIDARATWDDIVLPQAEEAVLRHIVGQVAWRTRVYEEWGFATTTTRGLGLSALFAGESGTGKTMAAEVIATALRLNLYRIDLSAVVSKYIGETEENLRRVFDAAELGGAILFFDEADALFGKRSEVKDSHDRYANIEINYLLQRMEAYGGLAILATNMKSALDQAFTRRLRFVVDFHFPSIPERMEIWQRVFPPPSLDGRVEDTLDLARLARLNVNGGTIRNIALNAAFLAAQAGTKVTMDAVVEAARAELRKMGRSGVEI